MKTLFLFIAPLALAAPQLKIDLVTELHPLEANTEQVFLEGRLWTMNSAGGSIDVYLSATEKVASVKVPHSVTRFVATPQGKLLVYGKLQSPWRFLFTEIDPTTLSQRTHQLDESTEIFPDRFVVSASGEIFISDIPGRSVWRYRLGGSLTNLGIDIAVPGHLAVVGESLYVVENHGLGSEVSNLVRINLKTLEAKRLFDRSARPGKFSDLRLLGDGKTLVLSQVWNDQVTFVDTSTDTVSSVLPVVGHPRSAAVVGNCLAIASELNKTVTFVNWQTLKPVSQWDVSSAGDRLKAPGVISVDATNGRVYLRSAYPCFGCSSTQSSVFAVEEVEPTTFALCK